MSSARLVRVFFYGSFINLDVLGQVGLVPRDVAVARLHGFGIQIRPLANIVPDEQGVVYGIVCRTTHTDLERLYGQSWVGTYLPEAVIVEAVEDGGLVPALCYIAPDPPAAPAADDYVSRIAEPARRLGFPEWYLEQIESFRSSTVS